MITDSSIEIEAPAGVVWEVFSDAERWPEWTASVTRIVALDGPAIEAGKRFEIKQPRMPKLVWTVTEVDAGRSWTWRAGSPGATTYATHEVIAQGDERTIVRQRLDQRGPLGAVVAVTMRKMTNRYLDLEARGLKARSEEVHRARRASAASA